MADSQSSMNDKCNFSIPDPGIEKTVPGLRTLIASK